MKTFISTARKLTLYIFVAVLVGGSPMAAFAEDAAPSDEDGGYVYDSATGRWSSNKWRYDAATNTYVANTGPQSNNTVDTDGAGATITDTGAGSNNQVKEDANSAVDNTTKNNNQINNDVSGTATSGSAAVTSNNTAGSAGSGNATSVATLMNAINSSSSLSGQPYTFSQDVYGDVYGDIQLAPELLKAMTAQTSAQPQGNNTINYNVLNNNTINNKVDLGAQSGDASVLNNTNAGGATSGNAVAIANVLNLINSIIASNGSFVGTINIHGNLYGDILMNREGTPSLIASNGASNPLSSGTMIANNTNLTDIVNNIDLKATSGTASTNGNTNAGNAKSGTANTNLVVMDLAGQQVDAKNAILVFVNVMGKWVGIIVDAPTGATAAVLGDDVTKNLIAQTGAGSNNTINTDSANDTTVNADSKNKITNNISLNAQSGDATVAGNTNAGDATSGNASAGANVFNMVNSVFNLSGFMRILTINILSDGFWCGNFGIDGDNCGTDIKDVAAAPQTSQTPAASTASNPIAQVFSFIPHTPPVSSQSTTPANATSEPTPEPSESSQTAVLAASDHSSSSPVTSEASTGPAAISAPVAAAVLAGLAVALVAIVRLIGLIRTRFSGV